MNVTITSLPAGNYYIKNVSDMAASSLPITYDAKDGKGLIKFSQGCLSTEMPETKRIPQCNIGDTKQLFTLTTDGRIYSYELKDFVDYSGNKIDSNPHHFRVTSERPEAESGINLWNPTILYGTPYTSPGQESNRRYFNMMWSETASNNCSTAFSPPMCESYQTSLTQGTCGALGAGKSRLCIFTGYNEPNRELCARGDSNIVSSNKLDILKCPNIYNDTIYGYQLDVKEQKLGPKIWMPWSKDTADTDATINFCAQHDTLSDQPMITSYPNCIKWSQDTKNITAVNTAKNLYCGQFPNKEICADWCQDLECKSSMNQFCSNSNNVLTPGCRKWCQLTNTNCDLALRSKCANLYQDNKELALTEPACACFMPDSVYQAYFEALRKKGVPISANPELEDCYFGPCARKTATKPYASKQNPTRCPDVSFCFQNIEISAGGNISGDISVDAKCQQLQPPTSKCSDKSKIYDDQKGDCVPCKDGFTPNADQTKCVCLLHCAPDEYQDINNCVCKKCPDGKKPNADQTDCVDESKPQTDCTDPKKPFYNTENKRCEPCPSDKPLFLTRSKTCDVCPSSQVIDPNDNTRCVNPNVVKNNFPWWVLLFLIPLILGLVYSLTRKRKGTQK